MYKQKCGKILLQTEFSIHEFKIIKANISLVVRVGEDDNVKLILVFTFKVASVSSAELLSVLQVTPEPTTESNNLHRFSYRLAPSSNQPAFIKSETTSFAYEQ